MWFNWSIVLLLATWGAMLYSSKALLEVNLHYEPGASFNTLVEDTLGTGWNIFNGLCVAFVLYILLYAYISGGGSIVRHTAAAVFGVEVPKLLAGLLFVVCLTACVWWSTWIVDRISTIMMVGMVVTFALSMTGMFSHIKIAFLMDAGAADIKGMFIFMALSTYLTSFCFHGSVPSMVKYFGKKPLHINRCLVYGTLIAFVCYTIWILAADGSIARESFKDVIAAGGNVGDLIKAAGSDSGGFIRRMLEAFAAMAVATSFLGAGLGLFDYIADLFKFDDSRLGRTKTTLVTFLPPAICGFLWPDGFLIAIGWAGFAAAVWSVIVPALMLRVSRKKFSDSIYSAPGGGLAVPLLLGYGIITAICHVLSMMHILPTFG
jgi:tryptophan-specific transport protein